jgi:D-alanyl-lipoteichoic acid acyltransferase DltB (MBOAT superfamily)
MINTLFMFFNSIYFAIFFSVVSVLYWAFSKKLILRNIIILVSRYVFCGWWDWCFLFLIIISSLVAFYPQLVVRSIERASHLLPQFYKTYKFNYNKVKSGLLLIALSLFKNNRDYKLHISLLND